MTSLLTTLPDVDDAVFILHRFRNLKVVIGDERFTRLNAGATLPHGCIRLEGPNSEEASLSAYPVGESAFLAQYISNISVRPYPEDKANKIRYVPASELDVVVAFKSCKRVIVRSSGALRDGSHALITVHAQNPVGLFLNAVQVDCVLSGVSRVQGLCMDVNITMDSGVNDIRDAPIDPSRFLTPMVKVAGNKARRTDLILPMSDIIA